MKVVYTAELVRELRAARQWYNRRAPGMGERLVDLVDEKIREIARAPASFPHDRQDRILRRARVAKGTADWLDVYNRMRMDLPSADATASYLDDALARALAVEPLRLLSYFQAHPTIPAAQVCGLAPPTDGVTAFLLEPRELLELERREQRLAALSAPEVERRELDASVAPARDDASLRARGDGSFPDGPFRVKLVPRGALDLCLLPKGCRESRGTVGVQRLHH